MRELDAISSRHLIGWDWGLLSGTRVAFGSLVKDSATLWTSFNLTLFSLHKGVDPTSQILVLKERQNHY